MLREIRELSTKHIQTLVALFVAYSLLACLRKPLSSSWVSIKDEFLLSSADYGDIISNYTLSFGLSKFIGGILSDYVPAKTLFAFTLGLAAVSNILLSTSLNIQFLNIMWALNGFSQGLAWPCIGKLILDMLHYYYILVLIIICNISENNSGMLSAFYYGLSLVAINKCKCYRFTVAIIPLSCSKLLYIGSQFRGYGSSHYIISGAPIWVESHIPSIRTPGSYWMLGYISIYK